MRRGAETYYATAGDLWESENYRENSGFRIDMTIKSSNFSPAARSKANPSAIVRDLKLTLQSFAPAAGFCDTFFIE